MGNDVKICISYNHSSLLTILLLKLCKLGRTTRSGTEIPLEVEMHTPSILN